MKSSGLFIATAIFGFFVLGFTNISYAAGLPSQEITLFPGWNIVSTPNVLSSHAFSVEENASNFDIYVLDPLQISGWSTMAELGQSEFTPLYGYFVNNKTGSEQMLILNYEVDVQPNEKLFERTFPITGWYSIGIANPQYAKEQNDNRDDTNNPNDVLSLLEGDYDLVIDFTDAVYESDRKGVALSNPWKAAVPADIDSLNDFRNTKGYAVYIKEPGAHYNGFQNDATSTEPATSTLTIGPSAENPDATILPVETNSVSSFSTIFAVTLDADGAVNDINVNSIVISVETGTANYEEVVHDAQLLINGEVFSTYNFFNPDTTSAILDFDTFGSVVEIGEEVTVELQLEFNGQSDNYEEGETINAHVTNTDIEADSTGSVIIEGSGFGETHTLRTEGVILEPGDMDTEYIENDDQSTTDNEGEFTIQFDVTAFATDAYVNPTAASGTTMGTLGANFLITTGGVTAQVDGISADLNSTADEEGSGRFKVSEGETETFTLTVVFDPEATGFHRVRLYSINWASTDDDPTTQQLALPAADYRTTSLDI